MVLIGTMSRNRNFIASTIFVLVFVLYLRCRGKIHLQVGGGLAELHLCLYLYEHLSQYYIVFVLVLYLGCRRRIHPGWPRSGRVASVFVLVFVLYLRCRGKIHLQVGGGLAELHLCTLSVLHHTWIPAQQAHIGRHCWYKVVQRRMHWPVCRLCNFRRAAPPPTNMARQPAPPALKPRWPQGGGQLTSG